MRLREIGPITLLYLLPHAVGVDSINTDIRLQPVLNLKATIKTTTPIHVTFDQNVKNAISAEFGILAVSLPDWWFLRTKGVIGTFSQTVKAGIF